MESTDSTKKGLIMPKEYVVKAKHALNDSVFVRLDDGSVVRGYVYGITFKIYKEGSAVLYDIHHVRTLEVYEEKQVFADVLEAFYLKKD